MKSRVFIALLTQLCFGAAFAAPIDCIYGKESSPPRANVLDSWNTSVQDAQKEIDELIKREQNNYAKCLDVWVGKDINALIEAMGVPAQTSKLPNGNLGYVWLEQAGDRQCKTSIFTKQSKIVKWQAFGNCRRAEPPSTQ